MRIAHSIRCLCAVSALGSAAHAQVSILASSEFRPALEELRSSFSAQSGIPTRAIYGSSGALAAKAKAPGTDVFISSSKAWADTLANSPRGEGPSLVIATVPVCIWTRGTGVEPDPKLAQLLRENVGLIAISDTNKSPDGRAAVQALHSLPGWSEVRRRLLVLSDPALIADSLSKPLPPPEVDSFALDSLRRDSLIAEGDTAVKRIARPPVKVSKPAKPLRIPLTDAFVPQPLVWGTPIAGSGRWVTIDSSLVPPLYPAVVRLKSANPTRADQAKSFIDFLQSPRGRSILRAKGFLPPPS
jgi:ABC-type molybdate transport system substrate-binding protein